MKTIQTLYRDGVAIMEIARRLEVSQGTVYRHIKSIQTSDKGRRSEP